MIVVLGEPSRLFLPNSVSVIGPALLGLCFSLVSLHDQDRWLRRLAWLTTISILLVILGSSLRSLWILTPVTMVGVIVAWKGVRSREAAIALMVVAVLALSTVGGLWRLESWAGKDLPDVLHRTPCSLFPKAGACIAGGIDSVPEKARRLRFDTPVDLPEAMAWRVMVRGHGEGKGAMVVSLLFFDATGREIRRIPVPLRAGQKQGYSFAVGTTPAGYAETRLRLSRWKGTKGQWHFEEVECAPLASPFMVRLAKKALAVKERGRGLIRTVRTRQADGDPTLGFRWHETLRVLDTLGEASLFDRLFGFGLGATVDLDIDGFDNRGHWIHYDDVNYIHNWYLFLLFKLGIVGTMLVLGSLLSWIAWTIAAVLRTENPHTRAFLTAAATAWIVYAVWSLTSPEILDFRMAALWGWLLSISVSWASRPEASTN
ncbi:MAG: hypothetical protein DRJ65_12770 [Acidobacteria bacterium]|nr:MAG: hypothetical protein DRJ65_12770 [Acidobacteriota bacterium]